MLGLLEQIDQLVAKMAEPYDQTKMPPRRILQRGLQNAEIVIPLNLARAACRMKNKSFAAEQEFRLVYQLWSDAKCSGFRTKGRLVIRYVEMPLVNRGEDVSAREHPIREIVVGPGREDEKTLNIEALKLFLATLPDRKMDVKLRSSAVRIGIDPISPRIRASPPCADDSGVNSGSKRRHP